MTTNSIKKIQDVFLNHVRKNKTHLTVFLTNGIKLQGIVTSFDNFCFILRKGDSPQLIYKHAVASIVPDEPINLREDDEQSNSQIAEESNIFQQQYDISQ